MPRLPKFISATDYLRPDQVRTALDAFSEAGGPDLDYRLGIGVMSAYQTIEGIRSTWDAAFPRPEEIAAIFLPDPRVFNVLHVADYRNVEEGVETLLGQAIILGGPNLHAIQLDMTWPSRRIIRNCREYYPDMRFILQVGPSAMEAMNNDPRLIRDRIAAYGDAIDYVLPDGSMGQGKELDPEALVTLFDAIRDRLPNIGLMAAGGLGPGSVSRLLRPVMARHPDVSCDAQGKLRPTGDAKHEPMVVGMAVEYTTETLGLARELGITA